LPNELGHPFATIFYVECVAKCFQRVAIYKPSLLRIPS